MKLFKKTKAGLAAAFLAATSVAVPTTAADAATSSRARATVVLNNTTGEFVRNDTQCRRSQRASNGECKVYLASVTKLMTAAVVSREIQRGNISMDDMVRMTPRSVSQGKGAIKLGLRVNDRIKLYDAMEVMAKYSANDVAVAIAGHVAGSERSFVRMMNAYAKELGMKNSHFGNSSGMPTDTFGGASYSTAGDMNILMKALAEDEIITHHFDRRNTVYRNINYRPDSVICTNRLQPVFSKTGWSQISGSTIAYMHQATDGQQYSILLFGYPGREQRNAELIRIINSLSPDQYAERQAMGIHWNNCSPYRGRV